MRSTLDIIIAVKECQEVSHEELRLALMALSSIDHFRQKSINDLIEALEDGNPALIELRSSFSKDSQERLFQAKKQDPSVWLGPGGIPGTSEHSDRMKFAKSVAKAAGIDLN